MLCGFDSGSKVTCHVTAATSAGHGPYVYGSTYTQIECEFAILDKLNYNLAAFKYFSDSHLLTNW